jgi:hypothetical protein
VADDVLMQKLASIAERNLNDFADLARELSRD